MFANFFGIVIISASALLIAGLVLRPTPDLPATMNLGLVDKLADTTAQASSSAGTPSSTSTSSSDTAASSTDDPAKNTDSTSTDTPAKDDSSGNTAEPATAVSPIANKQYFEIRKRAIDESISASARANKSDAGKYKD